LQQAPAAVRSPLDRPVDLVFDKVKKRVPRGTGLVAASI